MAAKLTNDDVQGLYRQFGPALLAYGASLLGDRAAAEDVLHQVFLEMMGKTSMPDEPRPYLFRAVRNRALNFRRGSERLTALDHHEWLVKTEATMQAALAIEKAMRELPAEQREVVVMKGVGRDDVGRDGAGAGNTSEHRGFPVSLCAGKTARALAEDLEDGI